MRGGGLPQASIWVSSRAAQATLDAACASTSRSSDGPRTAQLYREAGIEVAAFFIVGYPGETVAAIEDTFALR